MENTDINIDGLEGEIIELHSGTYHYIIKKIWFGTYHVTREPAIFANITQVKSNGLEYKSKIYSRKNYVVGDSKGFFFKIIS